MDKVAVSAVDLAASMMSIESKELADIVIEIRDKLQKLIGSCNVK